MNGKNIKIRIVADSTAALTDESKRQLYIVPLKVIFGSREYTDGIDITHKEFYEKLVESDALLQKYIEDSAHLWKDNTDTLNQTPIGSVIGTHAGPGAVAVAFFSANNKNI